MVFTRRRKATNDKKPQQTDKRNRRKEVTGKQHREYIPNLPPYPRKKKCCPSFALRCVMFLNTRTPEIFFVCLRRKESTVFYQDDCN
jgi:hypothetical protein